MTIPELLKEAYNSRDWSIIEEAYSMLTGQELSNGSYAEQPSNERVGNVRGHAGYEVTKAEEYQMPTSPPGSKGKPCRTESINVRKNKINIWSDDRTEAREDVEIDKKLTNRPLVPRTRGDDFGRALCKTCGNRVLVSKQLIVGGRITACDACIGGRR